MATRNIQTKLGFENEDKYKQALKEIGSAMGVLNSEAKKVTAQFEGQDNSVEALNARYDVLERTMLTQRDKVKVLQEAVAECTATLKESDSTTQRYKTQLNNAEAELARTENQMRATREALDDLNKSEGEGSESCKSLNDVLAKLGIEGEGLGDALDNLANKVGIDLPNGVTKALNGLGSLDAKMTATIGIAAAVVAAFVKVEKQLMEMTTEAAERADELLTLSSTTGVATDELQKFQYAEDLIDVSADTMADSLKDLTKNMADAADGNEEYMQKFDDLGVSIYNADGTLRDSYDVFLDVIDALGQMENQTERDAAAMGIINESAQQLNPLIEQGTEALRAYGEEAENMGIILTETDLVALQAVDDAQAKLLSTQEAVTNQISAEYAPYMEDALTKTATFIKKIGDALTESGVVESFGSILQSAASLLEPLGELISSILPALNQILSPIAYVIAGIADTLSLIIGAVETLVGVLTLNGNTISNGLSTMGTALGFGYSSGNYSAIQNYERSQANAYANSSSATIVNGYNASGTDGWRGGLTMVGENGPEVISLPQGSSIYSNQASRSMGSGDTFVFNVDMAKISDISQLVDYANNYRRMSRMRG
jgi:hypothetical protein